MVIAVLGSSEGTCAAMRAAVDASPLSVRGAGIEALPLVMDLGDRKALEGSLHLVQSFRSVADALDRLVRRMGGAEIDELTVVAESIDLSKLDPLAEAGGWSALISMLVLAFPDLHWCFAEVAGDNDPICTLHGLDSLDASILPPYSNLFDGSGLRNRIRERIPEGIPLRSPHGVAVAIDDERQYSRFSGLVAYRNGYRCFPIDSLELSRRLLGAPKDAPGLIVGEILWSVEDLNLKFPDDPDAGRESDGTTPATSLSDATVRLKEWPLLQQAGNFTLLTAERKEGANGHLKDRKRQRFGMVESGQDWGWTHQKPLGGLNDRGWRFHPFRPTGMSPGYDRPSVRKRGRSWVDLLPSWFACPECVERASRPGSSATEKRALNTSHSAPGRLVEVANVLLSRARWLCEAADASKSSLPAIRAAVLAIDARELLADKTPTTSVTAIEIRHEAEIRAECLFAGVVLSEVGVRDRIDEIRHEVEKVLPSKRHQDVDHSNSVDPATGMLASCRKAMRHGVAEWLDFMDGSSRQRDSALAGIVSRQLCAVDGRHQLDAELELLKEDRRLQNRIHWYQAVAAWTAEDQVLRAVPAALSLLYPFAAFCGMRYVNWLLNGLVRLGMSSLFWLFLLSYPLLWLDRPESGNASRGPVEELESIQYSVFTFLSIGQPQITGGGPEQIGWFLLVSLLMIIGLFHMSILISHLYTVASRR